MPPQIEEVITSWKALFQDSESVHGWRGINVSPIGSCEIVAARRFPGNEEALLVCLTSLNTSFSERLPEGKGFEVLKADPFGDGKCWIAITRKEFGCTDLFAEMITDLIGIIHEVAEEQDGVIFGAILKRIRMWQQFMSNSNGPLSSEAQLGLFGELHFIKTLLQYDIPLTVILNSWVGPEDSPQDFLLGDGAIEIKATMSSFGLPVKIGNLEQLDDAIVSPIFLGAARFVISNDGVTLPDIISEINFRLKDDVDSARLFFERLLCAGYIESHASYYQRKFELNEFRLFSVCKGFPRMTTGSVPLGILHAMYEINLDHANNFLVELDIALKKLGVVG